MTRSQNSTPAFDAGAVRRFHETVYLRHRWPDGALLAVVTMGRGRGVRTQRIDVYDTDALVERCRGGVGDGLDVYVNVAPQEGLTTNDPPERRGRAETALALPALFADVDTADGAHKVVDKEGSLPLPSKDEAVGLMRQLPLAVTVLVATGGGYHCWCCLDEPLDHKSEIGRELISRWKAAVKQTFNSAGRHVDEGVIADPARMLRIPGTVNFKRPEHPRAVRLLDAWLEPEATVAPAPLAAPSVGTEAA